MSDTEKLIEAVAKTLYERSPHHTDKPWSLLTPLKRGGWLSDARAALEAIHASDTHQIVENSTFLSVMTGMINELDGYLKSLPLPPESRVVADNMIASVRPIFKVRPKNTETNP